VKTHLDERRSTLLEDDPVPPLFPPARPPATTRCDELQMRFHELKVRRDVHGIKVEEREENSKEEREEKPATLREGTVVASGSSPSSTESSLAWNDSNEWLEGGRK
jgi:hypothetical protein